MDTNFKNVVNELEDLEIAVTGQIEYIIKQLLEDSYSSPKPLTKEETMIVIDELREIC